jgi:predicted membrane protein
MMPRSVVPVMVRSAAATTGFSVPLRSLLFGFFFFFFSFDFSAELFFFGVFGFAAFAFVAAFFVISRFVVAFFVVSRCFFVVGMSDEGRGRRWQRQGVRGGRRREQHQRGEQQDQQDRELPHATCIGGSRRLP